MLISTLITMQTHLYFSYIIWTTCTGSLISLIVPEWSDSDLKPSVKMSVIMPVKWT